MKLDLQPSLFSFLAQLQQEYQPGSWVRLRNPASAFSHDEALLLCQESEDEWVAWIPNYGETVLKQGEAF